MTQSPTDSAPTSLVLSDSHVEAIVSSAEAGLEVRRRYQFFVWIQGSLQVLLPHQLAICGGYSRTRHELQFEAFNAVPVDAQLLTSFADAHNALLAQMQEMWLRARCKPVCLNLAQAQLPGASTEQGALLQVAGFHELVAHGVSRPQRPNEIESFFVLASQGAPYSPRQRLCLELLMPHMHSTWQRVQVFERELRELPPPQHGRQGSGSHITERERQILRWLREGCSNPKIGETLGISPLTVKNHVQKILRKLGAANRAQAVAIAISLNLLSSSAQPGELTPQRR
ncbi:XrtB/PEP-CTERM-associated transcriptional regulator EpsA [Roseateles sp. P5_D6]